MIFGEIIKNFEKYLNDYSSLSIDKIEQFSKTLKKIKKCLKQTNLGLYNDFLPIINMMTEFNDDLMMSKIMENI